MNENKIKLILIDILSALFPDCGFDKDILEFADLMDDLGMDSITFISIIVKIEEIFGIIVPDDMLLMENFRSVKDIVLIVEHEIEGKHVEENS